MSKFQAPKGVSEYFPPNSDQFEYVRDHLLSAAKLAGYSLIELPVFEDTEVFTRGVGESTDVVSKEMYTFEDRGGRSITLRPEGTAGVMRAVIEHNLDRGQLPVKLFYTGPFFRAERPQAGRYRQFYQVGIEAIGYNDPEIDVEVISVADTAFKALGLKQYKLNITSLADAKSRDNHRKDLVKFIAGLKLDEATIERAKLNPLRLFDDKRDEIKNAITIILSTAFGERPFRPRFGCQIWELIFDPINDATFGLMEMYVEDALRMWEPRIVVDSVVADAGNGDGEVLLEIEFTIVSTNDKRNLVFPFYLIPAEED